MAGVTAETGVWASGAAKAQVLGIADRLIKPRGERDRAFDEGKEGRKLRGRFRARGRRHGERG